MLLNVLLFIPFGTGLRMRGAKIREALFVSLVLSTCIEASQLVVITGRTASPGDVLTNTAGGVLGAMLAPAWRTLLRPSPHAGLRFGIAGAILWIASLAGTAWAMQPQLWPTPLFAQIRPTIPNLAARYPGEVSGMFVNGVPLHGGRIPSEVRRASRLDDVPGELTATLRYREPAQPAILARVVDERRRTRLELRVVGADLIFEPSLRASSLRLSRPAIRLVSAFTAPGDSGVLRAAGGLGGGTMYVSVAGGREPARADAALRATLGWTLLLPMSYALGPEAPWLTAVWIAALVFLWSYWLGAAMRDERARGVVALGVAAIVIGLAIVPALSGVPATTWWEWVLAFGALALGASCGRALAASTLPERAGAQLFSYTRRRRGSSRGVARISSE